MNGLDLAIEQQRWDAVALYLLLGVSRAAALLPPESLTALVDLLAGDEEDGAGEVRPGGRR
jgi:hypothetical protein